MYLKIAPIPAATAAQWLLLCGAEEACWAHNPKVPGSKPGEAKLFGGIVQLVERLLCMQKVTDSISVASITFLTSFPCPPVAEGFVTVVFGFFWHEGKEY